jgi:UDP:flavonoid glycosyltransferase YjiC (YdhE family)
MKTILFVTFPYPSHYFPAFDYAREWQNKGYRVIFTVDSMKLQKIVTDEGFECIPLSYAYEYKVKTIKTFIGLFLKSLFDKRFIKSRYKDFYRLQLQAFIIKKTFKPEIICLDEHLCFYYPFFKDKDTEVISVNPMLSATKKANTPPLNSSMLATNTFFNKIACEILWFLHLSKLRFNEIKQQVVFLGKDDIYFLKRIYKKNELSYKDTVSTNHSFYRGIRNIKTILIAPKELEYDFSEEAPNETYFQKPISRNETPFITDQYRSLVAEIIAQRSISNLKVICCSFGTLAEYNEKRVKRFVYEVLSQVIDDDTLLVISSKFINAEDLDSSRIRVLPFLPHLDFLKYVDVMITHGGLGTVKECIQTHTPLIVYPIIKDIDQPGVAIRVQHKGFGLMGDLDKESIEGLKTKMNILLKRQPEDRLVHQ